MTRLLALLGLSFFVFSSTAFAQTQPPPPDPNAPPPGYPAQQQPPPAGYPPPPPAGYSPPPPGYSPPPQAGYPAPPPGYSAQPGYPPPPANYPPAYALARPPGAQMHDGFYLRLHLGGGYTSVSGTDGQGNKTTIAGGSATIGLALGGAIVPNLVLFGALFTTVMTDPGVTVNGLDAGIGNGNASVNGIGAGAAYYLQPVNLYFSGTLAATQYQESDSDGNNIYETDTGFGFQGIVGKEWWVSDNWGLGVAAEFIAASMKDKNDSSLSWTATAFSLLFSATFN